MSGVVVEVMKPAVLEVAQWVGCRGGEIGRVCYGVTSGAHPSVQSAHAARPQPMRQSSSARSHSSVAHHDIPGPAAVGTTGVHAQGFAKIAGSCVPPGFLPRLADFIPAAACS